MATTTRVLDERRLAVLDALTAHLRHHGVDDALADAVRVLVRDGSVHRADRMAVRPGDAPVLVERLAAWALRRASDDAVEAAVATLCAPADTTAAPVDRDALVG